MVAIIVGVDSDVSDSRFAGAADATLNLLVRDYQPSMLRLAEDDTSVFLTDEDSGERIVSSAHGKGIDVVTNQFVQSIVLEPLAMTRGLVQLDASAGDDTVVVHGTRFTSLDGGEGYDQLVLKLSQPVDLVDFLDGRVVGFEEIMVSSETSAELVIDMRSLGSVVSDDGTLLIHADADQNLTFLGNATIEAPIMIGETLAQVVRAGDVSLQVIGQAQWQNLLNKWDVNRSGDVTSLDALAVVNQMARVTDSALPLITSVEQFTGMYFDVSGDGRITSIDALRVINELSRRESSSEAEMVLLGELFETREGQPADPNTDPPELAIEWIVAEPARKLVAVSSSRDQAIRQLYAADVEFDEADFDQTDTWSSVLQSIR